MAASGRRKMCSRSTAALRFTAAAKPIRSRRGGPRHEEEGAVGFGVLTDRHFKGSLEDLRAVRAAVEVPILRKDFIFEPYQVYEARAAGADCILLIIAMLKEGELRSLAALARELGMATQVEAHNDHEFGIAEQIGAELIGINNRDLHTFVTDIAVTERLLDGYAGE